MILSINGSGFLTVILENQWISLSYNENAGLFNIYDKIKGSEVISNGYSSINLITPDADNLILSSSDDNDKKYEIKDVLDEYGQGQSLIITNSYRDGFIFTIFITIYEQRPSLFIQTSLQSTQAGFKLLSFCPFLSSIENEGTIQLGNLVDMRLFRQDWQSWSPVEIIPLNRRIKRPWMKLPKRILFSTNERFGKGEFLSDNFMVIKNLATQEFITLGFISMRKHLTQVGIHVNYEKNIIRKFFTRSLSGSTELKENHEIFSEKLVFIINGMNAVESLNYYASLVQEEMDAISWDPTKQLHWR